MFARSSSLLHSLIRASLPLAGVVALAATPAEAQQGRGGGAQALRSIEDRTATMRKLDGYFPLYFDSAAGQLFMEIPRLNTEVLHMMGIGAGLGSNDIGIDRGGLQGSRIVTFERSRSARDDGPAELRLPVVEHESRRSARRARRVRAVGAVGLPGGRRKRWRASRARRHDRLPGSRRDQHRAAPDAGIVSARQHAQHDLHADDA